MKRDSSPPEAIRTSGPNGAPGLVETSNSTRSRPAAPGSAVGDRGAEAGLVELQRRQLRRHRRVEPRRRGRARRAQRRGGRVIGAARVGQLGLERGDPRAARLDRAELVASAPRARPAARRPRPGACGPAPGSRTAAPRPPRAAPDRRSAPRRRVRAPSSASAASITARSSAASASASSGMLGGDPVEPPRRLAELGQPALRSLPAAPRWSASSSPSRAPACIDGAQRGEALLLARLRAEAAELLDRMFEPFAVALGRLGLGAGRGERAPRAARSRCQAASASPVSIRP